MLRQPNYIYGPNTALVPARLNFGEYMLQQLRKFDNNTVLINAATEERIPYSEILQQSMNFAISLTRMGVKKGDTIGLISENRFEFWGATIGAACAGAVVSPISVGYVKGELIHVLNISKPKYIICSPSLYRTHAKTIAAMKFVKKVILFGDGKQNGTLSYNDMVIESQLTVVPSILVSICKHQTEKYDLSSVQFIMSGAAPLRKDTIAAVHEKFPNLVMVMQGYGATELTLGVLGFFPDSARHDKVGSVGVVVPNSVLKVADLETGKPLGPNQRGELCVKGELLMKGYLGRDRGDELDSEGFYRTGDIAYYDEDGYFFIVDRQKELIKYKGYQVPPAELEAVLLQHEGIRDAAVIGLEDKDAGELPLAFVVRLPGSNVTEQEVKDFVAERILKENKFNSDVVNSVGTNSDVVNNYEDITILDDNGKLKNLKFKSAAPKQPLGLINSDLTLTKVNQIEVPVTEQYEDEVKFEAVGQKPKFFDELSSLGCK
ncbi:hypothetical protein HF086_015593 [Spodoptera exigua]|uniref:Luciferase n=1 Tax=Spodoptera exigua TaxID=7107 RepID=A0A922MCY5_SPOEX|nr:hypothetical protein HF086_015593 [Spodoptera exigua]